MNCQAAAASSEADANSDLQRLSRCRAAGNALAAAVQRHTDAPTRKTRDAVYDAWLDWLRQDSVQFSARRGQ